MSNQKYTCKDSICKKRTNKKYLTDKAKLNICGCLGTICLYVISKHSHKTGESIYANVVSKASIYPE